MQAISGTNSKRKIPSKETENLSLTIEQITFKLYNGTKQVELAWLIKKLMHLICRIKLTVVAVMERRENEFFLQIIRYPHSANFQRLS